MKVFKYEVKVGENKVLLPQNHKILHFNSQGGALVLWAEVADKAPTYEQTVHVIGTGWDVPVDTNYCGTALSGPYVWHLYK